MKSERITDKIWKFTGSDNVNAYFLDFDKKIFIDCGNAQDKAEFEKAVNSVVKLDKIEIVLFTHLHYDHTGNFDLFEKAKFYASALEIDDFKKCAPFYPDKRLLVKLNKLPEEICGIKQVDCPGHTSGSVCLFLENEKILFTGDTYFRDGVYGRTDLGNSEPEKMKESLAKIKKIDTKIICPGHDY
jgi:hydroxyacylglutathione hydrolase